MSRTINRGMQAFLAVHRPGDCDGPAVADLLADASRQVRDLGAVWVRQVTLDVDHHPHSTEISLTVFYDQASPVGNDVTSGQVDHSALE